MKIKNSSESISPDISIFIMCFGILVACPLRIYQMIKSIDPITGFYNDYGSIINISLYVILAAAAILILFLSFFSAGIPASVAPQGRHVVLSIASLVFAAALFYDGISSYLPSTDATATIVQNAQTVSKLSHIQAIFAILSCCYFFVVFLSYITGKSFSKKLKLLALAPLAWAVVRVLERLTVIINILRVSELLLELCALVFMMVFFFSFAKVASEINNEGTMWSVIACGSVSSLFVMTYSVPRLILLLTGKSASLVSGYPFNFADAGAALFMLVFIITTLRCGYKVEDIKAMNAEIAEAQADGEIADNEIKTTADAEASVIDETENVTAVSDDDSNSEVKPEE